MKKIFKIIIIATLGVLMLGACATKQPKNINNACSIIHQYPSWYYYMIKSYNKWGIPLNIQMAFIRQESSFRSNAKPSIKYYLGFIPIGRVSSAYGYAQALDGTWNDYKKETRRSFVSRSNLSDAVDFIGWYLNCVHKKTGISKTDTYNLYLAYNRGIGGYKRGSHKNNSFIKRYARKTASVAQKYSKQLQNCTIPPKPLLSYLF